MQTLLFLSLSLFLSSLREKGKRNLFVEIRDLRGNNERYFTLIQVTWVQQPSKDLFRLLTVGRIPYSVDQRISLSFR